jgi:hypothetical protein
MSMHFARSLQPLLLGSLIALSFACRRDNDRSNNMDTTSPTPETARSADLPPPAPRAMPDQRPSSTDLNPDERMPVAGRDDAIELGSGGATGTGGSKGSGGSGGSHH